MSTTQALTPQQQATLNELLRKFADRLLPAKLKNTNRNGLLLADFNVSRGLSITADTMYDAAKAIYRELDWEIKPQKLVLEEQNMKPTVQKPLEEQAAAEAKWKAGDALVAKKAADEKTFREIDALIASYTPRDRHGRTSLPKQSEQHARLRRYVAQEKARPADPKSILEQVNKEVERLYQEEARAQERI
jgi:hypothetical protein